ncbi:MAG: 16S rRNA (cytidine(1402)-2'-O)-methyltransferase [Salibacteraceae bacterium]|nr:16S rRNA (cytidine(1402)-2'-O)-methyltransferase [Salibacteraceae bacterium]|tara:strand:+ start:49952 stop:50617 length:666 start_codon:yes stop_codon:yes gene_type:complete
MLILVPTPIGNLEDITYRAIRLLNEVDGILAEDTRQTAKLLKHYEISKPVAAFHQHNEHKALARVIERLKNGETLAMVSDAGTPGISDPGFLLVRECLLNDIKVETLPGATAFVPALVNSGLPCDRFVFEGFLPHKKGRQTKFKILAQEERTIILYESPHRLVKTLGQLIEFFEEDREVCVSRELTKIYEENRRGKCSEVLKHYEEHPPKGEIVLIVAGRS